MLVPRWWREWLDLLRWLPLIRDHARLLHCLQLLRTATTMVEHMLEGMDAAEAVAPEPDVPDSDRGSRRTRRLTWRRLRPKSEGGYPGGGKAKGGGKGYHKGGAKGKGYHKGKAKGAGKGGVWRAKGTAKEQGTTYNQQYHR